MGTVTQSQGRESREAQTGPCSLGHRRDRGPGTWAGGDPCPVCVHPPVWRGGRERSWVPGPSTRGRAFVRSNEPVLVCYGRRVRGSPHVSYGSVAFDKCDCQRPTEHLHALNTPAPWSLAVSVVLPFPERGGTQSVACSARLPYLVIRT